MPFTHLQCYRTCFDRIFSSVRLSVWALAHILTQFEYNFEHTPIKRFHLEAIQNVHAWTASAYRFQVFQCIFISIYDIFCCSQLSVCVLCVRDWILYFVPAKPTAHIVFSSSFWKTDTHALIRPYIEHNFSLIVCLAIFWTNRLAHYVFISM